jgi:DNA (cytosine-5)-methyltransferase 1
MGHGATTWADRSAERQRHGPGDTEGSGSAGEHSGRGQIPDARSAGPTNGHWRAADWLACRDGKWRPVEPGSFPLANGLPARVGRLRGYGNAIVPQAAVAFVRAYLT